MATTPSSTSTLSQSVSSTTKDLVELNTNTQLPIKLNSKNYPAWHRQINSLLVARNLDGYITGETPCPSPTIKNTNDGSETDNPEFNFWIRQDKYLYIALLGSCDEEARAVMSAAPTARDAWLILERAFATRSRSRVMSLKERLNSIRKGSTTVAAYMQTIRSISDELSLIGHPVDDIDLVIHALNGLDPSFREFTASIRTRDSPIPFDALYVKLIDYEMYVKRDELMNPHTPVTANYANRGRSNHHNRGRSQPHHAPSNQHGRRSNVICQLCSKKGHSAQTCHKFTKRQPSQPATYAAQATIPPPEWLFDSGSSHHITNDLQNLSLHSNYNGNDHLHVANGMSLPITHVGSTTLNSSKPNRNLVLNNVLYAPGVTQNLVSVSQLCNTDNVSIEFFPSFFKVKDLTTGVCLLQGPNDSNVYKLPTSTSPRVYSAASTSSLCWHNRLGHPSIQIFHHILKSNNVHVKVSFNNCNHCMANKSHKLPFHLSTISSSSPLEVIYSDVWGPSPFVSIDNFKYYVIFIDHFSKYVWLYPLKFKSDVSTIFPIFKNLVENQFNCKIKSFYSDNGGEFIKLKSYFQNTGIQHLTTPPHTPQHNGLCERKHRHLLETTRCLLHQASLPPMFWSFAAQTAAYLINRLPTPTLKMRSPFFTLFQTKPNYNKLRSFGCLCFPWLKPYTSHKLELRSEPCVFLGYSLSQSAYICYNCKTNKFYNSRHVQFTHQIIICYYFQINTFAKV